MFALELLRHFQENPLPLFVSRNLALILVLAGSVASALDAVPAKPLSDGDLLALVAGNALPENIVNEIKSRGLGFHPDNQYRAQLETAGAEGTILAAFTSAKITGSVESSGDPHHIEFLKHLAQAGGLMRKKSYTEAVRELNAALVANPENASVGFVMGELLREQERWMPAASVYGEVLSRDPDFPEGHTKLAFICYSLGESDRAITEGKEALKRTPENAEAHKNLGLAWGQGRNFAAATSEYREALRIKPDYAVVHYDLGILYDDERDPESAISEYRKSIALEPGIARYHNNLANAFSKKGDRDGAIREYREAKRLDPDDLNVRNNLAGTLIDRDVDAAILEFRELVAIAPRFELCRICFGHALYRKGDFPGAAEQYKRALALDPSDPDAHSGLGLVLEKQQKLDEAIGEYHAALRLDGDSVLAHQGLGRIALARKDFANASREFKRVESVAPSQWQIHNLMAQALVGTGDEAGAVAEYKESLQIWPKNGDVMSKLAALLEKRGEFVGMMEQYREAASIQGHPEWQAQYEAAQQRVMAHVQSLKATGHAAEAVELESRLEAMSAAGKNPEADWRDAVKTALAARNAGRPEEALAAMTKAVSLAEKLQPRDWRLVEAIGQLAGFYQSQQKFAEAAAQYQRQLVVTAEVFGPQSPENAAPLTWLGNNSLLQHDYVSAERFYLRALELTEKTFGPTNYRVAGSLNDLAAMYIAQRKFEKAEPLLWRSLTIDEALYGFDNPNLWADNMRLGDMYSKWGKFEKAEPYYRKLLALHEKSYGADDPRLCPTLQALANVLTNVGKVDEAQQLRERSQVLMAAMGQKRQ